MAFIHKDFMLQNDTGKFLYHTYASSLPIFDYHYKVLGEQKEDFYSYVVSKINMRQS